MCPVQSVELAALPLTLNKPCTCSEFAIVHLLVCDWARKIKGVGQIYKFSRESTDPRTLTDLLPVSVSKHHLDRMWSVQAAQVVGLVLESAQL